MTITVEHLSRSLPWTILLLNPLTYGVNAIRSALLDYEVTRMPLDISVSGVFTMPMLSIAALSTRREL